MRTIPITLAALVALAACGGGGSNSGMGTSVAPQSVATSGTITAFGSVFVNGVRYDVSAAMLKKNGRAVSQAELAVGEVALVRGRQDLQSGQGNADSVDVEDNVVGPIETISAGGTQLTALGQTIEVTAGTSFDKEIVPADLSSLKPGDGVEISGFADASGLIMATRIGRAAAGEPLQVLGKVTTLDVRTSTHLFHINGLTVDFTAGTVSGFASGQPANGDLVIVRGALDANQALVADRIEFDHVAALKIEATAAAVDITATPNTLQLLGVTIAVDADTRFEDKSSAAVQMFTLKDVHDGDTIVVRGYESPAGSCKVLARELERLPASTDVIVRGPFTATTAPQFMILGVTIDSTNASFDHGEDGSSVTAADFYTQAVGQIIEARSAAAGSMVTATEVRIDSVEDR